MKNIFKEIRIDNFNSYFGSILQNPDAVLQKTGKRIENMRELVSDAHVWSAMQSRKSGSLSLDWNVDDDFIKNLINNLNYQEISRAILDAVFYGYSILEIIWERNTNKILPIKLKVLPIEKFSFDSNGDTRLYGSDKVINSQKLIIVKNNSTNQNPYGEAVLTRCYWPVKFKNAGFRFWANYMERFGSPLVLGKYPRGTSNEDAEKLLEHLSNLTEDSAIVSPEDVAVEIKDANNYGTSAMYSEMIDKCNAEISKAILSQTLTSEVTSGSKAAAETHLKVRAEVIESDIKLLENAWNELITKIYSLNSFNSEKPIFKIDKTEIEAGFKLERDKILVKDCGLNFTKDYWVRNYRINDNELD